MKVALQTSAKPAQESQKAVRLSETLTLVLIGGHHELMFDAIVPAHVVAGSSSVIPETQLRFLDHPGVIVSP